MSSIAKIMGLTNYNPHKEAITALIGGAGLYLIDLLHNLNFKAPNYRFLLQD